MKYAIVRALRTFVQAALGYICVNLAYVVSGDGHLFGDGGTVLAGVAISAVAAGLAAVMNLPTSGESQDNAGEESGK